MTERRMTEGRMSEGRITDGRMTEGREEHYLNGTFSTFSPFLLLVNLPSVVVNLQSFSTFNHSTINKC